MLLIRPILFGNMLSEAVFARSTSSFNQLLISYLVYRVTKWHKKSIEKIERVAKTDANGNNQN